MQLLERYEKDQVLKTILEHFDCSIEDVSKKELAEFAYTQIKRLLSNSHNLQPSRFKKYSMHEVSVVFIYQELFSTSEHTSFDAYVENTVHKENAAALIYVSCNFANAYAILEDESSIAHVNEMIIEELVRLRNDEETNGCIRYVQETLFKEEDTLLAQKHLQKVLQLEEYFSTIEDAYEKKLFSKEDIVALMMLSKRYHDESLEASYSGIKKLFGMTTEHAMNNEEIKQIVDNYRYLKSKKQIHIFNHFAMDVTSYVKNLYLIGIDDSFIESSFLEIVDRMPKWYSRLWTKKDTRLLNKNTILIQQELHTFQESHTKESLNIPMFKGDFKVFSSVAILLQEYDLYFNTVVKLGNLLEEDFTAYIPVAGMNIKNYYESSNNPIAIEAINRFLWFWILLNEKSLHKKLGK